MVDVGNRLSLVNLNYISNQQSFLNFYKYLNETNQYLKKSIGSDTEDIQNLFRCVHTLKGNAAIFNLTNIVNFCHDLESKLHVEKKINSHLREELKQLYERLLLEYISIGEIVESFSDPKKSITTSISSQNIKEFIDIIVSSTSKSLNKDISLNFIGISNAISISREKYEHIEQSLAHIINNCIDHGIKTSGVIDFRVEVEDKIIITISDNGSGIDIESFKLIAKESGIDTINFNKEDFIDLMFLDKFSTKTSVSRHSGRGVGMAYVKSSVESVGGNIKVTSDSELGTIFKLIL
jgi:chemotaxis protein histidine kinase CheA